MNNNRNDTTPTGVPDAPPYPRVHSIEEITTITSDTISQLPTENGQMTGSQNDSEVRSEAHLWNGQCNRPLDPFIEKPDNSLDSCHDSEKSSGFGNHRHHDVIGMDTDIETSVEDSDDESLDLGFKDLIPRMMVSKKDIELCQKMDIYPPGVVIIRYAPLDRNNEKEGDKASAPPKPKEPTLNDINGREEEDDWPKETVHIEKTPPSAPPPVKNDESGGNRAAARYFATFDPCCSPPSESNYGTPDSSSGNQNVTMDSCHKGGNINDIACSTPATDGPLRFRNESVSSGYGSGMSEYGMSESGMSERRDPVPHFVASEAPEPPDREFSVESNPSSYSTPPSITGDAHHERTYHDLQTYDFSSSTSPEPLHPGSGQMSLAVTTPRDICYSGPYLGEFAPESSPPSNPQTRAPSSSGSPLVPINGTSELPRLHGTTKKESRGIVKEKAKVGKEALEIKKSVKKYVDKEIEARTLAVTSETNRREPLKRSSESFDETTNVKRKRMTKDQKAELTSKQLADRKKKQNCNNSAIYAAKQKQPLMDLEKKVPQLEAELEIINKENNIIMKEYLPSNDQFEKSKNRICEDISAKYKKSIEVFEKEYIKAKQTYDGMGPKSRPAHIPQGTWGAKKSKANNASKLAELKLMEEQLKMEIETAQRIRKSLDEFMMGSHATATMTPDKFFHVSPVMFPNASSDITSAMTPLMGNATVPTTSPYMGPTTSPYMGFTPYKGSTTSPYKGYITSPYKGSTPSPYMGSAMAPRMVPVTSPYKCSTTSPRMGSAKVPHKVPSTAPYMVPTMAPRMVPHMDGSMPANMVPSPVRSTVPFQAPATAPRKRGAMFSHNSHFTNTTH